MLTVVDTSTRLSSAIDVQQRYRGSDVVETRKRAANRLGYLKTIRLVNGPEFIGKELDLWAFMEGVPLDFSRLGKPTDNAFIESLNRMFRAECLNANWFLSLDEAFRKCEAWRRDCNEVRPHSAMGNKTPMELPSVGGVTGQPLVRRGKNFVAQVIQGWRPVQKPEKLYLLAIKRMGLEHNQNRLSHERG